MNGSLERDSTDSIKGIWILYIFLCHAVSYIPTKSLAGVLDSTFISFSSKVGQLCVVMFLFYSGYGVAEAIKHKGEQYIDRIPTKRVLTTLLNFDVAVCCFIILDLILNIPITLQQSLLALTGWDWVGNSNWYIFCILILYISTYISFKLANNTRRAIMGLVSLTITYIVIIQLFKGNWWGSTALAYTAGIIFGIYKHRFQALIANQYRATFIITAVLFTIFYLIKWRTFSITHNLCSVCFAFLIVMITMKWRISNPVLRWCGVRLFPLYIYQRLPMILFATLWNGYLPIEHPYIFIILSLIIALVLTYLHKYIDIKLPLSQSLLKKVSSVKSKE